MQRWIKLPNNEGFLDADRILLIGSINTFPKLNDEGSADGVSYAVNISTDVTREHQMTVTGDKETIANFVRSLLGAQAGVATKTDSGEG